VFVSLVIQYVERMRRILLSSVACRVLPCFFTLFHERNDFRGGGEGNVIDNKVCVCFFYVLLTVYLSIILAINQLNAKNLVL